ncbi:A/G-specific adenine glycosylase [Pedobacter insulae]|uniref:Adenine DNA glycosylase n=1 Tax=Pedobacter insulae TaxID=414048 RepID=A0A1I2YS60_9SPHI|nr:A/G-specific adenine glycosylase [Pedobacter insulae]SFH27936.1 A/G-specific DNA-adenine glycosylase [Pedobacter insulae]
MSFQKAIVTWYQINKRELPWRSTTDAYVIWLSEIILQQTRVEQGLPYFHKFLLNFPTVRDFANANEDEVLKLWQGLGYYSRGRNMLFTAQQIVAEYNGIFPVKYSQLIKLKGIGDYTAAAISSFAANESKAVVDGNVFRVLSRYFGINVPINSNAGKKLFSKLAQELIVGQVPAVYNQAIMEFGALQCKPKPGCETCPIAQNCSALINQQVNVLPVKLKLVKVKERWLNYLVASSGEYILIKQRQSGDVWQKLYDFPVIETSRAINSTDPHFVGQVKALFGEEVIIRPVCQKRHLLTHQIIYVHFFVLENYMINFNQHADIKSVLVDDFKSLPHPKVISDFTEMYL